MVQVLGTTVLSFTYDDRAPWPVAADGNGFSIVPVGANSNPSPGEGGSWRASAFVGGSPGADDPSPSILPILINEALTATGLSGIDAIELFNPTPGSAAIGGWFLTDEPDTPKKFRIPDGLTLSPGGFAVFDENQFNPTPGIGTSFSLRAEGDDVYLFSADSAGNLTGYSHGFSFGAAEHGVTFGRHVLSTGDEDFTAQEAGSLGATNSGPRIGPVVITEIHYHPDIGDDEFIEIQNITGEGVPLFDLAAPTNVWRINGLSFTFPPELTLASNAMLLVVSSNPSAFRSKYNVPDEVTILGPFAGQLQDSGERIALQKPGLPDTNNTPAYIDVDMVRYNDKTPWPPAADGSGPSLQRKSVFAYGNDPIHWEGALPTPGRDFVGGPLPIIIKHPANVSVVATREAEFHVVATGAVPIFYQWRHNGSSLLNATNAALFLTDLKLSDSGDYTVLVFNASGSAESFPAVLTVLTPPSILAQPTNRLARIRPDPSAALETNVTFNVVANSTTPLRYQWRFNGVNIPDATNASHTVFNVQLENEGVYSAALTDGAGTIFTEPAYLQPLISPVIVRHPAPQFVTPGSPVTMSVAVGGHPKPFTYEWRRGASGVFNNILNSTNSFYRFSAPNVPTSQVYRVIVKNLALPAPGVITMNAVNLTVLLDTDEDGIPDAWEAAYNFNTNNAADAVLDWDNDRMLNWQEFVAGTDPTNSLSYLKIDSVLAETNATIAFGIVSNKSYTVEFTDSLSSGSWSRLTDLAGRTNNATELIADPEYAPGRFYRLVTPRQP
jgi:hypothetical protein